MIYMGCFNDMKEGIKVFATLFKSKFGWHEANFPCCLLYFKTFILSQLNVETLVG